MSAKYTFAVYETIVGSATQKLILLKLADNANDDGIAWPGMDYLSKHCELSKSAILRNLKALEEKGFIRVKRRKSQDGKTNLSNVYQLTIGTSSQLPPSSTQPLPPSSSELPESNNIKPNNESSANALVTQVVEIFNNVKDEYQPNWAKCDSITKPRTKMIKDRIKDVEKRIKETDHTVESWFIAFLVTAANDQFYSGKPKFNGDTGYKWSIDNLLREKNFVQAIERLNDE